MKSYTDLPQSKKLAEILRRESADMEWIIDGLGEPFPFPVNDRVNEDEEPCWSLAALLNYLREIDFFPDIEADECSVTMSINYYDENEGKILCPVHNIKVEAESFVDACYEMVLKLYELKIL